MNRRHPILLILLTLAFDYAHSFIHPSFPLGHISHIPLGETPKGRSRCQVSMISTSKSPFV